MTKIILISILFFSSALLAQTNLNMNFDLYQNAANNIISMEGSFPLIYSGNINGNSYYFELEQPTVEFNQNYMKMIAVLKINTTLTGYVEIDLEPSIYVNYSLSTDMITAFLENFPTYINTTFPQIPQWIRDKIIDCYQSLELEMYPAKILDYAESYVPNFLDIEISNIGFSIQSLTGKLQIGITFDVTGIAPYYKCYTYNRSDVKITTNVSVNVIKLTLLNTALGIIYHDFNGNIPIPKDSEHIFDVSNANNLNNSESGRKIRVLLESDVRGTFLRVYDAAYMPHNNQWYGPRYMQVSFD